MNRPVTFGSAEVAASLPRVSVIVACRNEAQFIGKCLQSIVTSDYPLDRLEILVVDGQSEDATPAIVAQYAQRYPMVRLLHNDRRITPVAFNLGITHSTGELVMIMSAHATYERDAIAKCVEACRTYGADNVGGTWRIVPRNGTFIARCVVAALSHTFGVGNAAYRTGAQGEPLWVDTAAYGCYRREVFADIGLFNEKLVHSQDMEFNRRLLAAGGRTLLVPDAVINYYAPSDFRPFCRRAMRNGMWAVLPFLYSDTFPVSLRHLAPLAFALGLIGAAVLSLFTPVGAVLLMSLGVVYLMASLAASADVARRRHDVRMAAMMPLVFASLHFSYGFGSINGMVRVCAELARRRGKRRG